VSTPNLRGVNSVVRTVHSASQHLSPGQGLFPPTFVVADFFNDVRPRASWYLYSSLQVILSGLSALKTYRTQSMMRTNALIHITFLPELPSSTPASRKCHSVVLSPSVHQATTTLAIRMKVRHITTQAPANNEESAKLPL
jgi:hypothetical protein